MRLFKRNRIWWLDVTVNGQRYRFGLDTTDKREAKSSANKKIAEIEQGKLSPSSVNFAKLGFDSAADKYLESRRLELQPSSYAKENQLLTKPREYFSARQLSKIGAEQVLGYREWRKAQNVGNTII